MSEDNDCSIQNYLRSFENSPKCIFEQVAIDYREDLLCSSIDVYFENGLTQNVYYLSEEESIEQKRTIKKYRLNTNKVDKPIETGYVIKLSTIFNPYLVNLIFTENHVGTIIYICDPVNSKRKKIEAKYYDMNKFFDSEDLYRFIHDWICEKYNEDDFLYK